MLICNYVYEHVEDGTTHTVRYTCLLYTSSISLTHLAPFVDVSRKKIAAEVEVEMEGLEEMCIRDRPNFGTLAVDLGCFPFDNDIYLTLSDSQRCV